MSDLLEKIRAEINNDEMTLGKLDSVLEVKEKGFPELAALAIILQNFYNGIENILKQILLSQNVVIDKTQNWHKELLENAKSEQILSKELTNELYEYLIFRHYFIHSYALQLEEIPLTNLTDKIYSIWEAFYQKFNLIIVNSGMEYSYMFLLLHRTVPVRSFFVSRREILTMFR